MICAEHNKEYKGPNSRGKLWHVINFDKQEYCTIDPPKPISTSSMEQKSEEIRETLNPKPFNGSGNLAKSETYKIQKQHSQEMSIRFLDYCKKHNLTPAEEITTVESWTKIFMEDLEI